MTFSLYEDLQDYLEEGSYPLHMPGHKRNDSLPLASALPYDTDLTELPGTDDLHHASGILKDAMDRTAAFFGAYRTWYLVGGSTAGILAGIYAAVPFGSRILCVRNCHQSVFHAIELLHLSVTWLYPPPVSSFGIPGSISPESVSRAFSENEAAGRPPFSAAVLTSPTYEGVVSDVASIAGICHAHDVPLIVDEAHGAHFGLFPDAGFPDSALHLGADLAVQSAHKTLPSLTQTALLHLSDPGRISPEKVEHALSVFETSSPSYPLMVSLDECTRLLKEQGNGLFMSWKDMILDFYRTLLRLNSLRLLSPTVCGDDPAIFAYDRSKLLVRCPAGKSASDLAGVLRDSYGFEVEMTSGRNLLAMTGCMDDPAALKSFAAVLLQIDREYSLEKTPDPGKDEEDLLSPYDALLKGSTVSAPIAEALSAPAEEVPVSVSAGRIIAEYLTPCPPGIPLLLPGEQICPEHLPFFAGKETVCCIREDHDIRTGPEGATVWNS